ncbi:MAG: hypothetical protein ACREOO_07780 [bacterium]
MSMRWINDTGPATPSARTAGAHILRDELSNISSTPRELRNFGLTMAVVSWTIGAALWWRVNPSYWSLVFAGLLFGALGLLLPAWLRPVQRAWMALALLLGFVMNRVILTAVFWGMFAPAGLILRILRKDLLRERWDGKVESYWVKRTPGPYLPQNSEKMY